MRLSRLFILTTCLLLGLVMLMLGRSIFADWRSVEAARAGLAGMERTYLAMKLAERASAERGPTNVVLGDSEPAEPAKRARLNEFRALTDLAFTEAATALREATDPAARAALRELEQARDELTRARAEVERVAALPPTERVLPGLNHTRRAVDQMFGVVDTLLGAVTTLSASAEAIYPELAMPLVGARYAAELREYAGRLGSQFAAPLAVQAPLGARERKEVPELVGRIEQLRKLIQLQARVSGVDARIQAAMDGMQAAYFAQGLPLIHQLTELGLAGQPYGIDPAGFVAAYVPPMKSIVALRDTLFESARDAAARRVEATERRVRINLALGLSILGLEIGVLLLIRRRVLIPVLRNTRDMVAIMDGRARPVEARPPSRRRDEIGDMERAVAALREATERSRALEAERVELIEQLRRSSDTDFLTGLPNRRAFASGAATLIAQARRHDWPVALMVFDLDHFKRINDRFGHPCGDRVLRHAAEVAQAEVRQGELLARHGGEEFVLLAPDCSPAAARLLAERLRSALAQAHIRNDAGDEAVLLTASFGVSCAAARELSDLDTLVREADKALYAAKAAGRNRVEVADRENHSR